jgi:hypothetical protein
MNYEGVETKYKPARLGGRTMITHRTLSPENHFFILGLSNSSIGER